MKLKWKIASLMGITTLAGSTILLASCGATAVEKVDLKISSFNLSFAIDGNTDNFARWEAYMATTKQQQDELISQWRELPYLVDSPENNEIKEKAERVIQIRNIAAIIQNQRPDVLLVNEFNSDGTDVETSMYKNFQDNFLAHGQSLNSIDGGDLQEPINYPFVDQYATNTGLLVEHDFDNNGTPGEFPADTYGYGFFHGHYAFGLMSMHEIVEEEVRTFQEFKWKDMPGAQNPVITAPAGHEGIPPGMTTGDPWYTDAEWNDFRLSSKNHVDAPITIKKSNGTTETIHLLMSHPTPSGFDTVTQNNALRNAAEVEFWKFYIQNEDFIYDDAGVFGGIDGANEKFVIMGDLNADPLDKDGDDGIVSLSKSQLINSRVMNGDLVPTSTGAMQEPNIDPDGGEGLWDQSTQWSLKPEARTSTFGRRVDYALPSANLEVIDTSVFWKAEGETGRLLFNDYRIGTKGDGKQVSSDHRLVSVDIRI